MSQEDLARVLLNGLLLGGLDLARMTQIEQEARYAAARGELLRLAGEGFRGTRRFPSEGPAEGAWGKACSLLGMTGAAVRAREKATPVAPIYTLESDELVVLDRMRQAFLKADYVSRRPDWL
jgi:hypothetical protein